MAQPRRIPVVFACYPSLFSTLVLKQLLDDEAVQVLAVVESTCIRRRGRSRWRDTIDLLRSSGIRYALYQFWVTSIFAWLACCRRSASVARLCAMHRVPVVATRDINQPQTLSRLQALLSSQPTAGPVEFVTVSFNQKLGEVLLANTGFRFINLHPGALPAYRGVDPVFAALLNRESRGEVTLHITAAELDTGDVLDARTMLFAEGQSLCNATRAMFATGGGMLLVCLKSREGGSDAAVPQQGREGYYGWPRAGEVGELARRRPLFRVRDWRELVVQFDQ